MSDYTSKRVGIIQLNMGKYDDAIKYLTESYKLNLNDPQVLYNLDLAFSKKKDFKTALTIFNKCLIIIPNNTEVNNLKRHLLNH